MPTLNVGDWVTNLMKAWVSQTCRNNMSVMKLISWLENRDQENASGSVCWAGVGGASEIDAMSHYNLTGFK